MTPFLSLPTRAPILAGSPCRSPIRPSCCSKCYHMLHLYILGTPRKPAHLPLICHRGKPVSQLCFATLSRKAALEVATDLTPNLINTHAFCTCTGREHSGIFLLHEAEIAVVPMDCRPSLEARAHFHDNCSFNSELSGPMRPADSQEILPHGWIIWF